MKQVTQNLQSGATDCIEVPAPRCGAKQVLIKSYYSLLSSGTERMLVDFSKAGYLQKAKQQPEKVKEVLQKVKTDGWLATIEAVKSKLDQPLPLGYCNVGEVIEIGANVTAFKVGDIVASNGSHAEFVTVSQNLCAKVPATLNTKHAAFTVLGSIALQSVRLCKPELGETFVVSGLGMVGLLTVQLLRSHGCKVIGLDFNPQRLALAERFGAQTLNLATASNVPGSVVALNNAAEVDGVIIAASTTSSEPVSDAAKMCRQRGRVVLVGVTGLELSRNDFYKKEISFQVSCSYGPGRYDHNYEVKGVDYPIGFVRWTEQRNFQAVLHAMSEGWLQVDPLITHNYKIANVDAAYSTLTDDKTAMGILLSYDVNQASPKRTISIGSAAKKLGCVQAAVIGAGNYAARVLLPAFAKTDVKFHTIYANTGVNCQHVATKFKFVNASTDMKQLAINNDINTVIIATQHNSHAQYVCECLQQGMNVFVEKPLALTMDELETIEKTYTELENKPILLVGFNRRFSPFVQRMKKLLDGDTSPMAITMTINAGHIPPDHWTQDLAVGGGRIIGEACHFIDLARYLVGVQIIASSIVYLDAKCRDTASINLQFANGSIANINYFANGNKNIAKERIEVYSAGKVLQLNNFRSLFGFGFKSFNKIKQLRQNKGQDETCARFINAIENGDPSPIPFNELMEVAQVCIQLAEQR